MGEHRHLEGCLALFAALCLIACDVLAQTPPSRVGLPGTVTLPFTRAVADSGLRLPHRYIVERSESVAVGGRRLRSGEYLLDRRIGFLRFDTSVVRPLPGVDGTLIPELRIEYRYLPIDLRESYALRTLGPPVPSTGRKDSLTLRRAVPAFSMHEAFGPNLQKSGSLVRGFTLGSNRDLSLNSGLRLQLSGPLTPDLNVTASLTDENTPLQPEGTTQTLQEFDRVFVELRGRRMTGTLGDFVLELQSTEFGRLNRRLQGIQGEADFQGETLSGSITAAGAVTRGRFHSLQFPGVEGMQGPYRLSGRNGELGIIVIAGTERVYINGEKQVRGEQNDYTIDYSTGEVTFQTRRLITSASRITIDFEYADRQYTRSLIAAQGGSSFLAGKGRLTVGYYREADNQDAPLDFNISDSSRTVLEAAGGDRWRATIDGAVRVDSNGTYLRVDTVITGSPATIYRYAPGDPGARYIVSFSRVENGTGEYLRKGAGIFEWVGKGKGDYLPLRFLPLPEMRQLANAAFEAAPAEGVKLSGEFAGSSTNLNRFSSLPGTTRRGSALSLGAEVKGRLIDFSLRTRRVGAEFETLDRTNEIEFDRKWGIDSLAGGDESLLEGGAKFRPFAGFGLSANYGSIRKGNGLSSRRWDAGFSFSGDGSPTVAYDIERIGTDEGKAGLSNAWLRHRGTAEYRLGAFTPGFRYEGEKRSYEGAAGLRAGSFRFDDFGPTLQLAGTGGFSAQAEWGWRNEWGWAAGSLSPSSRAFTQTYAFRYSGEESFSTSADLSRRRREVMPLFQQSGEGDVTSLVVRNQIRYSPFRKGIEAETFYEIATQRSSRLERLFVRVAQGAGTYRYLGDLNGNGLADEAEFVQTRFDGDFIPVSIPSERPVPVIDLRASTRLRITPSRMLEPAPGLWSDLLSSVATETYLRVDEKSTDPDITSIALLRLSRYRSDSTTITGSGLILQDILIREGSPVSARLRYQERRGLNNFSGGAERGLGIERSLRIRLLLIPGIAQQIDLARRTDRVTGSSTSPRLRDIRSEELTYDLSYRPEQRFELGLKIGLTTSTDRRPEKPIESDLNSQSLRFTFAFAGSGQLRAEFVREEVALSRSPEIVPFELTGGRLAGKTWIWRSGVEFRVTSFLEANGSYEGRSEGGSGPIHTGRGELRAFF